MQRIHYSTHMRKYRCNNRCCVDFINMTKLFVSLYNRFNVLNLFDLKFRQSKFDSRFLQILNSEFFILNLSFNISFLINFFSKKRILFCTFFRLFLNQYECDHLFNNSRSIFFNFFHEKH